MIREGRAVNLERSRHFLCRTIRFVRKASSSRARGPDNGGARTLSGEPRTN